jgi:thiopeptide-type bacteriocin biosynthesis protein
MDEVLRDVVAPVVAAAQQTGAVDRWFFIRYGDPDWHLRLRLHGEPARLSAEVLPALQTALVPLLEDRRAWRMQLDTYEQEAERYGGAAGIALAEQIFHADSEAVLALLPLLANDARGDLRWRLACASLHLLLIDFGFDFAARHAVLRATHSAFAAEFGADDKLRHQIATRFRSERSNLDSLLALNFPSVPRLAPAWPIFRRRSERLAPVMAALSDCDRSGQLTMPLPELAHSYLHMHANRLFPSGQRAHELVLYDFLLRHYQSQAARARSRSN